MHRHQVLTGAANPSDYSFAAGSIENIYFVAYTAGYNIVILSGDFHRVQVLLSGNETNQCLLTCIDCTYESGKIVAGFGNQICIYEPSTTTERSWHHQVNYRWSLKHTLTCSAEKITAVAWHPGGDQLISVDASGLQVWFSQGDESEVRSSKVSFEIGGSDTAGKTGHNVGSKTWKHVWSYKSASPIKHVAYSNDGTLFATASQSDRLVKVWYQSQDNNGVISFTSTYLPHPRAVTYISWRQTSRFFAQGTVANCLLTCCKDNICRIWFETVQQDESAIYINDPTMTKSQRKRETECLDKCVQKLYKLRYNNFSPIMDNRLDLSTSNSEPQAPHTPALLISSNAVFMNDEELNNANGHTVTALSSSSSSSSGASLAHLNAQSSSFSSTNHGKRFHLATTINPSTDSVLAPSIPTYKEYMFIVQWLNNKDLYNLFSIEQFLDAQRKSKQSTTPTTNAEVNGTNSKDATGDYTNANDKNLSNAAANNNSTAQTQIDDSKHFQRIKTFLKQTIDEWKNSPDVVFSIHPIDGSLLLWVIDWLDQPLVHSTKSSSSSSSSSSLVRYQMFHRQVQVSFSARIPDIFPLGDALSLQPHLIIYCNQLLFDQYLSLNQAKQKQHLPIINMITKHTNGTLNLWSLTFHEEQKFQSLICVTHTARMCGHHFPIRHIVCHPTVPLVLTSSYYDENNELNYGKKQRYDNSLILWSTEPIGPLTMTGGITELARMESTHNGAFKLIAWFPLVLPCMSINLLRESPSVLFCASDGKLLRVYQVICNAKALLTSQLSTSKSYQVLGDFESGSVMVSSSSSSVDLNVPRFNIVSNQSTARPSCVISLAEISDSKCIWVNAELIHIFPANAIDDRTEQLSTCKIYYLVLVEKSNNKNSQSFIHMWKIMINYPDDDCESISMNSFTNESEWLVQVQSLKVCTYALPLEPNAELQSVDVAFGHLSSSTLCYSDSSSSSPYLLSTTHADGIIRFWTCQHKSSNTYEWSEWCGITLDNQINTRLKISAQSLAISNAYCGRLAVAYFDEYIRIGIYECESTGGTAFNCETVLPINEIENPTNSLPVNFDWASIENGAHLLAASIGIRYVFIYSYTQASQWTKLRSIELISVNRNIVLRSNLSLKWVRGGLLLIGINSELQVYSQWTSLKRQAHLIKSERLIKSKRRINTTSNLRKNQVNADAFEPESSWLTLDSIDELSLFHAARNAAPVLPQYHPTFLLELVRFGKYRRVKAILAHLTRCIVSTVHGVEGKVEMNLMRSRTFSIANNDTNEPSIAEVDHVKYVEIDAVPLLPLFALFNADHETTVSHEHLNRNDSHHDDDDDMNGRDKYDDLFTTPSPMDMHREVDFKFDEDHIHDAERKREIELNKFRKELLSNRNWSPVFDSRMVELLVDYFQRVRLSSLTSIEQMYLLALADTLANSRNDSLSNQTYAGEKPTNAVDDCGLRFLIDVQRYIYLSRLVSPQTSQGTTALRHIVTSASYAWAFHSDSQEDLLGMLPSMAKNKPVWSELKIFGVGWWIRNKSLITKLFEKLAKAAFELTNNPLDSALYFLSLKKKSFLYNLFKHTQDSKMQEFFKNDFTDKRWIIAAQKNAFALLAKQRFEHAAAFFLLGGYVKDAVKILINNLNDVQLALLIARLHEAELPNLVTDILNEEILSRPHSDPFYRSMAYWMLKDYGHSLNTLLFNDTFEQPQSIFIFYDYLKQHPLVVRAKQLLSKDSNEDSKNFSIERRIHFQTAYYYLKTGCPLLALEILAKLPPYIALSTETKPSTETTNDSKPKQTETIDWSQPVSTRAQPDFLDWSQPVSNKMDDDDGLKLEWDDDQPEEKPAAEEPVTRTTEQPPVNTTVFIDSKDVNRQFDTIGQYMKLICCLKIIVEEMATLATGFEVTGGQLRHHLACWLEQEIGVIRRFCNISTSMKSDQDDPTNSFENLNEPILSDIIDDPTSTNLSSSADSAPSSFIRSVNFETKMKRSLRRRHWLQSNEHLLRTLVSFTSLHGMHGGGLASVRMELLLLMHELYRDRCTQLKNPIPFPTQVPLLVANLSGALSVSNSPISYMRDLSQDLLRTMNSWLTLPKLTDRSVQIVAIRDLSIALASCVYQSLCHTNENQTTERIAVESFLKSYLNRRESVRLHRRKSVSGLIEREAPTTAPKDWPGIRIFASSAKDQENNLAKLRILLVEILVSVYMSLLIYALLTDDCNTLYRLLVRKWCTSDLAIRLWYGVFGGGAKKARPNPPPSNASSSGNAGSEIPIPSPNDRVVAGSLLARKMMIPNQQQQQQQQQTSYVEVFIPPRASIVNYFMAKLSSERDNHSNVTQQAISEEDEDEDDNDDDDNEDESSSTKTDNEISKKKQRKLQEREHTNSMSYSWVLMRYAIVRLIYKRLWEFFPHIGIEKHEIPSLSPLIQQLLQNLSVWQDSLRRTLESFDSPPDNYLPLSGLNTADEPLSSAVRQHRTLLDPNNTPFSKSVSALPAKRLWAYLVNDELSQQIFIKYIFKRKPSVQSNQPVNKQADKLADSGSITKPTVKQAVSVSVKAKSSETRVSTDTTQDNAPVAASTGSKLIYRDSESIHSFCVNSFNPTLLAAGLMRDVIELDISSITSINERCELSDDENEMPPSLYAQTSSTNNRDTSSNRITTLRMPTMGAYVPNVYLTQPSMQSAANTTISGDGQHILTIRHAIRESRKFANHPILPHYLVGCVDGSVYLLNWSNDTAPRQVREANKRVTKIEFSNEGNKFGVADIEGNLSLHVLSSNRSSAYTRLLTHTKNTQDFVFLDSSTLLATCGLSNDHQNVSIWDTLMPTARANITSFNCHEASGGGQCLAYSQSHNLLISGGKRADICIFDIRQRKRIGGGQAHESNLKAMCLDPLEKFYVTGSSEGNVKIWRLHGCEMVHCFNNEHFRRGFLNSQISGVNHLHLTSNRHLFSSGADGTISVRQLTQLD